MRPTLRNVAFRIAALLGLPDRASVVHDVCVALRHAGLAEIGRSGRGGVGAPLCTSEQAILVLLALASGRGPRDGVRTAHQLLDLPYHSGFYAAWARDLVDSVPLWRAEASAVTLGALLVDCLDQLVAGATMADLSPDPNVGLDTLCLRLAPDDVAAFIECTGAREVRLPDAPAVPVTARIEHWAMFSRA